MADVQRWLTIYIASFLILTIGGAKVLVLPMMGENQAKDAATLGRSLALKGHRVYAVVNGDCQNTEHLIKSKINLIKYNNTLGGCIMETDHLKLLDRLSLNANNMLQNFNVFTGSKPFLQTEIDSLLSDFKLIKRLKVMNFDVVLIDGSFLNRWTYVLSYKLQKPTIVYGSLLNPFEAGIPALPSLYSSKFTNLGKEMSFIERVKNNIETIISLYALPWLLPISNSLVSQYAQELPYLSLSSIAGQTTLWLQLNDDVIDFPTVTSPNTVQVGGINAAPPGQLTEDLQTIADNAADNGLIVISFGQDMYLPSKMSKKILKALKDLKQSVIMKYNGYPITNLAENTHLFQWIPQNDILGHPNTKLFITHCGNSEQFEALYHAVPLLCIPVFGEHFHNAHRAVYHGIGTSVDSERFTVRELKSNIQEVLTNETYKNQIQIKSDIFHNRQLTPVDRAVFWIEYVIKYGGENLRPTGMELGFFQYWCFDLLVLWIISFIVFLYLLVGFLKCLRFCFCPSKKLENRLKID